MPRTAERGGPLTRAKILDVAHHLFLERGYDAVTVAEVARAAGVSSVTVFNHFPSKEDLFLDRADETAELLRSTVRDRGEGVDALSALRAMTMRLIDDRAPAGGVDPRSTPFFRTVGASPALVSRAREIGAELQAALAEELEGDQRFDGDAQLFAALFLAGYTAVMVGTARRVIAGESPDAVIDDHRARFERMFGVIRTGFDSDGLPATRE